MRKLIVVLFLFAGVVSAQHTRQGLLQPTRGEQNLRGPVAQLVVTQHYATGNDINFQETYCYDREGNLTEYRKRGFGGERVTLYPLTPEEAAQGRQLAFDYDGDLVEERRYDLRGRLVGSTHYIYAEGGNLVQSIEYGYEADSGVVSKRTVARYDKQERLVEQQQYAADELLLWSEKRSYDRKGNLVRRTQTFYHDDVTETTTERRRYEYDRQGNWTECRYSLNDKEIYTISRQIQYFTE